MSSKIGTITGGRAGFVAAINEAFAANSHNPTVRYSHSRGFHVESGMCPADDDVVWQSEAHYRADDGGRRNVRPSDYAMVRQEILDAE